MLEKMFDENSDNSYDDASIQEGQFLAEGSYTSNADQIMSGYKTFQKKYVIGRIALRLLLVVVAAASCVLMIITNEKVGERAAAPFFFLLVAISVGIYFIQQPIANSKKLKSGIKELEGTMYKAEFYTDKVRISTISDNDVESSADSNNEKSEPAFKDETQIGEDDEDSEENSENSENEEIPATLIHLNSYIVDLLDREDMYIICVKKSYVFIIPKTAFKPEDLQNISEKLSVIMGIRYKLI